jgi:hypothetical protein
MNQSTNQMRLTGGVECYKADCKPIVARGRNYTDGELSAALEGPVSEIIRDDTGRDTAEDILAGIADTDFEHASLTRIISHSRTPEDWRVGEAFAECHLRDDRSCTFPWPAGRDQKNPNSSLPGADLVGFKKTDSEDAVHRFAFGEVKTSHEERHPPQVMCGRHGLVHQLESLRDDVAVKDHLVKYLTMRAVGAAWEPKYKEAAVRYLSDPEDVTLFGVLVRDIAPNRDDLRTRAKALATNCPKLTKIELTAIYFPENSIEGIGQRVRLTKEGRHARN